MTTQLTHEHTSALEQATIQDYVCELKRRVEGIEILEPGTGTTRYSHDAATAKTAADSGKPGPAVVLPSTAAQVQAAVKLAAELGVTVVPRGAGTGLSGGATAHTDQIVVSTEKLTRIIEVSPLDEVAVVEPGVINADLNKHLEPFGLFYAPDPASFDISSIGGNIATNAGGLRCAKYGVTRESILSLDVVLPDGSLITVGHRSIKGVTGLDLTSLFVGSEGILGIVIKATVRLRPIPVARKTVTAFFNSTTEGAEGLAAITLSPVRPAAIEFFDTPSLANIDAHSGTALRERGAALILIEIDGYGIGDQAADLATALTAAGGRVTVESDDDGVRLWELRRSGRGLPQDKWYIGEDIAVPKSQLPKVYAAFPDLEARFGVEISAVSHAGDGNLHPLITKDKTPDDGTNPPASLAEAATELVKVALSLGGTVTGEHGVGTIKREWAALELSERSREVQHAIKAAIDPQQLLNPGKAI
ncbi:FAD-binding oxidoreductase [Paenarthrobacter nitroguajacolicus]|uniref:FAD-binding oxidoreductase n=1 Tax=Paenarthrobacter nitroguajacolicus TaxID=211146 RepID=UPI003435C7E1